LQVQRFGWQTTISLQDLRSADYRPPAMAMVVLPLLLWAIAALSIIVGYVLTDDPLPVQRLGWKTAIRLQDWRSADYRPPAMDPYRAFVTDLKHTVVLTFPDRKIVLSPANPGEFVDSVLPRQTNA